MSVGFTAMSNLQVTELKKNKKIKKIASFNHTFLVGSEVNIFIKFSLLPR